MITRDRRIALLLRWAPVLAAAVFLVFALVELPQVVLSSFYDSDVATAPVIGEYVARGLPHGATIYLSHYPWTTTLWWELLTYPLPHHRQVWEAFGPLLALGAAAILGVISFVLAGRWAAALSVAATLATSPLAMRGLVTPNFRTTTWFSVVVAGAFVVLFDRRPRLRADAAFPITLGFGVFLGANVASDQLLLAAAVAPLALTALALALRDRALVGLPLATGGALVVAGASYLATEAIARSEGVSVISEPVGLVRPYDLGANVHRYLHLVWQQANGDFSADSLGAAWVVHVVCAVAASVGLVAVLWIAASRFRRGRRSVLSTYALFWALVAIALSAAFVLTSGGQRLGWYLIALLYAAPAVIPVAVTVTRHRLASQMQLAVALVACFVITVDLVSLARHEFRFGGPGPLAASEQRIERIARQQGVSVAYADYWSAASLTWGSHMRLPTFPIRTCGIVADTGFCPMRLNSISSWFLPRSGVRSMLVMQQGAAFLPATPDARLGAPIRRISVPPFSLYIFGEDVAARFG